MTAIEFLGIVGGTCLLIPLLVYLTVKAGRVGWHRANDIHRESQEIRVKREIMEISRESQTQEN